MPQQTYEITAPNGKTLSITGDHVPNEAELQQIFAAAGVSTDAGPKPLPETRMPAGVPARGRGTQLDPDKSWRGVDLATTPLAHPTGITAIDGMTSPVGLASLAAGGVGIARAGIVGGLAAGAREAASVGGGIGAAQAKYWGTKLALIKLGVNPTLAEGVALAASGIKKGAKGEPPISNEPPTGVESAQATLARRMAEGPTSTPSAAAPAAPVASAPAAPAPVVAAPAPPGEPVSPPSAPPSPAASAPTPPAPAPAGPPVAANTLPDQKALNEAALAIRRQAYQQRLAASQVAAEGTPAPADAAGYVKPAPLTKAESIAFWDYIKRGMSGADAMKNVQLQRELAATLGTPTPTVADTKFPKGMRGKANPPHVPPR